MKDYEVEVMGRYAHGCYGKEHYFGMVLSAENCKAAETFADDLVYDMTYQEFFERCVNHFHGEHSEFVREQFMNVCVWTTHADGKMTCKYYQRSLTDKIKDDHKFTFKARVFKG